jgi:hypothetical protein
MPSLKCRAGEFVSVFFSHSCQTSPRCCARQARQFSFGLCFVLPRDVIQTQCTLLTYYVSIAMEDAHTTLLNLNEDQSDAPADAFFAVFDGHGGNLTDPLHVPDLHGYILQVLLSLNTLARTFTNV